MRAFTGAVMKKTSRPQALKNEKHPSSDTPGRPRESGSRQQTHPDQGLQSGSSVLDKEATRRNRR
jgi:hypothetical protein